MDEKLHSGADFNDYDIAQKSEAEIGYPHLRGAQALPAEASNYEDETISSYEDNKGIPYTAEKLGYGKSISVDPQIEMKVRAVDDYIRQQMQDKGLHDSKIGYQTIFERMVQGLETPEGAKNSDTSKNLLNLLFMQVAIANRVSSKTYLEQYTKRYAVSRVSKMMGQLEHILANLK